MNELMTREEWDGYSDEDKWTLYRLTEEREAGMKSVLEEIPECPDHGFCLPFKRTWILEKLGKPHHEAFLLAFDRSLCETLRR